MKSNYFSPVIPKTLKNLKNWIKGRLNRSVANLRQMPSLGNDSCLWPMPSTFIHPEPLPCRLHRQSACFQTGFVQGGKIKWAGSRSGYCPEGPPKGRTWFEIEVN